MKKILVIIALLCATIGVRADIVDKPNPPRLVNDIAGIMSEGQITFLEDSLVRYDRRTSTQITVITISDLEGYDIADYAYQIGQKWGVGQKGKNNGIVILVKPKLNANDKGHAFIASGYGLEGVLPDITCSRIVRDNMIPLFKRDDYAAGIIAGAIEVMKRCDGEYQNENVGEDSDEDGVGTVFFVIILIIIIAIAKSKGGGGRSGGGGGWAEAAILGSILNSGSHSSTGWGSFSSGGGSFGGFGGGNFGGGGGGGSW